MRIKIALVYEDGGFHAEVGTLNWGRLAAAGVASAERIAVNDESGNPFPVPLKIIDRKNAPSKPNG